MQARGLRLWVAVIAALCMVATVSSRAADVVREIAVRGMGDVPVEESFLRSHVTAKVGEPLSPEAVSRDVRTLVDTRHYTYVGTRVEPVEGGVRLVYVAEGRRRLAEKLTIMGDDDLSQSKIRELADLSPGTFVDGQIAATAASKVQAEYRRRRYYDATVEGKVVPVPGNPGAASVQLTIIEGRRYRVPLIRFEGNEALSDARLRRYSGQSPWWNPTGWFATKRVEDYDLELLRSDARKQYADLGYLDAQVSVPQVRVGEREHRIRFTVQEGPRYNVGRTEFAGITLFPEAALRQAAGLKSGAIASKEGIERSAKAVRDYYASRGYVDTAVRAVYSPGTAPQGQAVQVNLLYEVTEGELTNIRNVLIRGNTRTKDKVIRREITLNPGELFNEVEAERSDRRLTNLGYFESVRHYDVKAPDGLHRDVVYEVVEKPTGQFLIGAGFSSVDHLIGFMELSQGNFDLFNWGRFTGGGQKARVGVEASSDASSFELSFVEPWLLDQRLALNVDAFLRNRGYSEYDERRAGGSLGLSKHVPWIGRMGLTYTLQEVRLTDIIEGDFFPVDDPTTTYRYTDELDRYTQGSLRLNWTYLTLDNPMVPTRGTRATAGVTAYGDALGGGPDMYELSARARHYIPTFYGHVISFYVRSDAIDSWSDDAIPISNRYFLGGGRNVRGFRYREVGPKVRDTPEDEESTDYRPLGGQTLLHASAEYTIPITRFFRVAAFYDIGNVWSDPFDYDLAEYASSVGGGFRLDFPGFPIRLDYAYPLERDDDYGRIQRWVFWVGFD